MDNSIQNPTFVRPSSWRYECWCSVWPSHPGIQEQRTTWRFPYQNSHTSIGNYPLLRNCIYYKNSLSIHKGIIKERQNQSIHCSHDDKYHNITWQQRKFTVYTGVNINGLCCYLEMIGDPNTLTTSGQRSCHFGPSSSINNDIETLLTVISYLCMIQKIICEFRGRIGYKADACIIRVPKLLPPSIRRNMKQLNAIHGDEPTDTPREWNRQP